MAAQHQDRVRVVVADDHPLYREGVARAIKDRPELELVGEASDGGEALALIRDLVPEVALLDLRMRPDGPSVLRAIRRDGLPTRVVFLSAHLDSALVYAAIEAGAAGYLSKSADRNSICDALCAAARGKIVMSEESQGALADQIRFRSTAEEPSLTARELDVLGLATEGLSVADMAERLHLSAATIKTHLGHIYQKLEVPDRTAAVAEALRRGLLK